MEGTIASRTTRLDDLDGQAALSLHGLVAAARRQGPWLVGTAGLVLALTLIITLRQRPVYEARATLRVEERPSQGNATESLTALPGPSTIETETEILRSRTVAQAVVDSVALQVAVTEPMGVPRDMLLRRLHATPNVTPGTYVVRRELSGFRVVTPDGREARGSYGTALSMNGLELEPVAPSERDVQRIRLEVAPSERVAAGLRDALRVARPEPNAAILSVSYRNRDPNLAADVVNAVARSYVERRNQFQKQLARAAVDFLREQVRTIGGELRQAEAALERFRRVKFVIDPQAQASEQVRRLAELRARQEELTAQRSQLRDLLARTRLSAESAGSWADFVGTPSLIASPAMTGIVQQLSTVEAERARLLTWRTAADPDVAGLGRTIQVLRTRLSELVESQLRGLDDAARSVDSTLTRFDVTLQQVPAVELQYARLHRQVDLDGQLYTLLQTRLKESEISEAMEIANIQVVDPAIVPSRPVGPRRLVNLSFGTAGGLLLGLLVALAREGSDTRVRSRDEVVGLTQLPLLASIPRIAAANGRRKQQEPAEPMRSRLVIQHSPQSAAAEAYRALRTNIAHSRTQRERPLKTLAVTSPEPWDGKTTTAVNLAIALAEQGHRAILVADQRRSVLHEMLQVERAPGLSDVLTGRVSLDQVIRPVTPPERATGKLDFIPPGSSVSNPAELVGSAAMPRLLTTLAERYDAVVLDTPPVSVVTDAAVLGTLADGVIVVARMGATHGEALRRSVEELEAIGARLVGTVLTDVHHAEDRYGYRHPYEYYHDAADGDRARRRRL